MSDEATTSMCKKSLKIKMQKPLIKWVGGKTQIIDKVLATFPEVMNNYYESFLGGGSVLLALLSYQRQNKINIKGKIYAYDINPSLIFLYQHIQSHPKELFVLIMEYLNEYDKCPTLGKGESNRKPSTKEEALQSTESYYYWCRIQFNTLSKDNNIRYSALFVFLNKTCFRGIYREGPNGFNVPFGHYKKTPQITTEENLLAFSALIKNVHFVCASFEASLLSPIRGDFVYLDPPYAPETSKSFVGYTAAGFNLDNHKKLFEMTHALDKKGVRFAMSNAKVGLVTKSFQDKNFIITDISARRACNSKNPGAKTTEVIIRNVKG
jgi:DNA adenine methylase